MTSEDKSSTEDGEIEFPDLLGERKKSGRTLLKEAFDVEFRQTEEMELGAPTLCLATSGSSETSPNIPPKDGVPAIPVRFRGPVFHAPGHDLFGEVVQNTFQQLLARNCPVEVAHKFAMFYAHELDEEMGGLWKKKGYSLEVYDTEGTSEAKKKFSSNIWPFVYRLILQNENPVDLLTDKWTGIYISADQLRGRRAKQEDRFLAYPDGRYCAAGEDDVALLAVFDGHGGSECSQYAASHFWEDWRKARREFVEDTEKSLVVALETLDERMTKRSQMEHWKGGTTAVCCAVDLEKKELALAWLGDSPGYILHSLDMEKVTRDHSPDDPIEASRVQEAGGQLFVIGGELRVNGVLNLTRALGDVMGRPMISNEPESRRIPIEEDDYLVVLACDGISDVFDQNQLYQVVEAFVEENTVDEYADLAEFICNKAIEAGTSDNVTVVIGFLRPPQDLWKLLYSSSSSSSEISDDSDDEELKNDVEKEGY